MNLSRFRLVTFDVTNTLIKFRVSPGKQYGEIGAMYGITCDTKKLTENFKVHWYKMNHNHPNFGYHSGLGWENWWKQIIIGTFKDSNGSLDDQQLTNVAQHLIDAYKSYICWQHCLGALDLLSYLKHKRIPLGVISNFDPRLNTTLENARLRHYFQFVLTSYEVGIEKPDSKIFQEAMKISKIKNLKPDECLHIGDNVSLDYVGAKSAGWNAVLINDDKKDLAKHRDYALSSEYIFSSLFYLHNSFVNHSEEKLNAQFKNQ